MLKNNNNKIISRMAKNSLQANRRKNSFILIAVILSAFMVTAVLTLGASYYQASRAQLVRQYGAKHDAVLAGGVTEEQIQVCREDREIAEIGLRVKCGNVQSNGRDDTLHTGFAWCNETYWERQRRPALQYVTGSYPQREDELMISEAALNECGEEGMGIGSTLDLIYEDEEGVHRKVFTISGIFQDYHQDKEAFVSEEFFKESGYSLSDVMSGTMYLGFKDWLWSDRRQAEFEEKLSLGKQQTFFITNGAADQLKILAGMAGIVLVTLCSGYLLIYNILYLTVTSRVRYFGLLQTIGMTERQIRSLIFRQMAWMGGIGLAVGMLLGGSISMALLPELLRGLGIQSEGIIDIRFRPWVYLVTVLLTGATIYMGSRRPAQIAGSISPVEAVRFAAGHSYRKNRRTKKGCPVLNIALRNLQRERKRTVVVTLSMGLSVSLFICIMTLIQSQEARTLFSLNADADMVIENDTFEKYNRSDYKQIFEPEFIEGLEKTEGVEAVHVTYAADIIVPWEEGFPDDWMRGFYEVGMADPYDAEEYKNNPERFYSVMVGVDEKEFEKLNAEFETPVDTQEFIDGESCLVYRGATDFSDDYLIGQRLRFYPQKDGEKSMEDIRVAGVTDDADLVRHTGFGPNIVVSSSYLKKIVGDPYIQMISIQYKESYDKEAEQQIKKLLEASPCAVDASVKSRIEIRENLRKSQGNIMIFGIGIAVMVGFIGLMNYINTTISNIRNRLVELSVLESIGMTGVQTRMLLVWEGLLYLGLTALFTVSIGTGATYLIFQAMNNMNAPFGIPAAPVIISFLLIGAVCTGIPIAAYQILSREGSVIERIREL